MRILEKLSRLLAGAGAPVDVAGETGTEPTAPAPPSDLKWGRPARCPKCQKRGYLDRIDVVERVMYQHCPSCWHSWIITEDDIRTGTRPH